MASSVRELSCEGSASEMSWVVEPICPGAVTVITPKVGLALPELSDRERIELPAVDGGPNGSVIVVVVRRCFPLTTFLRYAG